MYMIVFFILFYDRLFILIIFFVFVFIYFVFNVLKTKGF